MPTMPNVVGLEHEAALASMVAAGVRVLPLGYFQTDPVVLSWITGGTPFVVNAQNPVSGATVAANSAVVLTTYAPPMGVASPAGETNFP